MRKAENLQWLLKKKRKKNPRQLCKKKITLKVTFIKTSGQDGGIGRHVSPPPATTERIQAVSQNK